MPVFFQQQINDTTRLGIWKIEETEEFFKANVPQHRDVTHPHKRLQHLAGRFLLQYLFPAFPYELIKIADTRKPFLPDEQYHFSISHCGDFAAAIVSKDKRVGVDIEIPEEKILKIQDKFLSSAEKEIFFKTVHSPNAQRSMLSAEGSMVELQVRDNDSKLMTIDYRLLTLLWSAKESVFKWYGDGGVDFKKHIQLKKQDDSSNTIESHFEKNKSNLIVQHRNFDHLVLAWVIS